MAGETVAARFWAKVNVGEPDECWEWTAGRNARGYGVFHPVKESTAGAHRFALELHLKRSIGKNMFVLHSCDNPPCVNPNHLREGTNNDNVQDAVSRGRHKRGSNDVRSHLTDNDVLDIRTRAAEGERNRTLAAEFNLSEAIVSMITRGIRWKHVGGPISRKYNTRRKE